MTVIYSTLNSNNFNRGFYEKKSIETFNIFRDLPTFAQTTGFLDRKELLYLTFIYFPIYIAVVTSSNFCFTCKRVTKCTSASQKTFRILSDGAK